MQYQDFDQLSEQEYNNLKISKKVNMKTMDVMVANFAKISKWFVEGKDTKTKFPKLIEDIFSDIRSAAHVANEAKSAVGNVVNEKNQLRQIVNNQQAVIQQLNQQIGNLQGLVQQVATRLQKLEQYTGTPAPEAPAVDKPTEEQLEQSIIDPNAVARFKEQFAKKHAAQPQQEQPVEQPSAEQAEVIAPAPQKTYRDVDPKKNPIEALEVTAAEIDAGDVQPQTLDFLNSQIDDLEGITEIKLNG